MQLHTTTIVRNSLATLVWKPEQSGVFSISSAYHTFRTSHTVIPEMSWIWSPRLPLKVSIFFWRVFNFLLPFPEILMIMGFQLPSKCPHCPSTDSMFHCFILCPLAQDFWSWLEQLLHIRINYNNFAGFLSSFWHANATGATLDFIRMVPILACWLLWKMRNQSIFDGVRAKSNQLQWAFKDLFRSLTLTKPFRFYDSSILQQVDFISSVQQRRSTIVVSWLHPPFPLYKLNVDGSSLGNPGQSGGGAIVRDSFGHFITAECFFFGHGSSLRAELLALLHGLQLCQRLGLTSFQVELDSQLVVNMARRVICWPWQYQSEFDQLFSLLQTLGCPLTHVYREANSVADQLSKIASSTHLSFAFSFQQLPTFIKGLLSLDRISFPYLRRKL